MMDIDFYQKKRGLSSGKPLFFKLNLSKIFDKILVDS